MNPRRQNFPSLRSSAGETMVMVLIAAAMGSVVAMVIANVLLHAQLGQSNLEFRNETDDMAGQIAGILSDPASCAATFQGGAPTAGSLARVNQVTPGGTTTPFVAGKTYGVHSTKLLSLNYDSYQAGTSAGSGTVTLNVATAAAQQTAGASNVLRKINVNIQAPSGSIASCVAAAKMTDGIWQRTPANTNDIFFTGPAVSGSSGGLVGINNASPTAMLDVVAAPGMNMVRLRNGAQAAGLALVSDASGFGNWGNPAYATNAGYANSAGYANTAGYANSAGYANTAGYANSANSSNITTYFWNQNTSANMMWWNYLGGCDGSWPDPRYPCANSWGLIVDGKLVKTFVIDNPTDPSRYLVHGTLEGPEGAVFYRGDATLVDGVATVTLPHYFEALTRPEGRTVQLTAIDGFDPITVVSSNGVVIRDGRFTVRSNVAGSRQRFHWLVMAVRADVDPLVVEPKKSEYEVHGVGPYTYGRPKPAGAPSPPSPLERSLDTKDQQIRALRDALCEINPSARVCRD